GDDPVLEVITLAAPRQIIGSATSPNLLLITHGTRDNAAPGQWVEQLAAGMAFLPNSADWQVVTLDWRFYNGGDTDEFANDSGLMSETFDPFGAANNGINIGESLVRYYDQKNRTFQSVQLMAHSAGSWLIDSMSDEFAAQGGADNVHLT